MAVGWQMHSEQPSTMQAWARTRLPIILALSSLRINTHTKLGVGRAGTLQVQQRQSHIADARLHCPTHSPAPPSTHHVNFLPKRSARRCCTTVYMPSV